MLFTFLMCVLLTIVSVSVLFVLLFYNWSSPITHVRYSRSFRRKCRALPAPKQYPVFGIALKLAKLDPQDLWNFLAQIMRNIGDVGFLSVLGLPSVYLMAVEDIEALCSSTQHLRKGREYLTLLPWLNEGLLTSSGDKWHSRRKLLTPTFHFQILENFVPVFNQNAKLLTEQLMADGAHSSSPSDIDSMISIASLSIICETTMGISLDCQSNEGSKYVAAIHRDWIFYNCPIGREFRKLIEQVHGFTRKVIKERKVSYMPRNIISTDSSDDYVGVYKERVSFLDKLIEFQRDNPTLMTDEDIREEVDTFMFEGHDTVSNTITWTLFMIATHPDVQDKLQQELKEIFRDSLDDISSRDVHKMQYLDMVLKETLRLYPVVPIISREISTDLRTKEFTIPAGMNVLVTPYLLHRDPKWYPEPEKFDPDRFLPDVVKTRHSFAYIPFSAGFRNCIGQKFAVLEAKIVLATILRRLKVTTTMKANDVKATPALILRPTPKIELSFSPIS